MERREWRERFKARLARSGMPEAEVAGFLASAPEQTYDYELDDPEAAAEGLIDRHIAALPAPTPRAEPGRGGREFQHIGGVVGRVMKRIAGDAGIKRGPGRPKAGAGERAD